MNLKPLRNNLLFTFLDTTSTSNKGKFVERATKSGIVLPTLEKEQHAPRWATVVAIGPEVDGVVPGDLILIEPLQWTIASEFEGEKIWKTDDQKILAVTNDESATYAF